MLGQLTRKMKLVRNLFVGVLALNVFLWSWGVVAIWRYLETHDPTAAELAVVGVLTFVFGIVLPITLFFVLSILYKQLRTSVEEKMREAMKTYLDQSKILQEKGVQNPLVWINLILLSGEIFLRDSDHPASQIFQEISPVIRREFRVYLEKLEKAA